MKTPGLAVVLLVLIAFSVSGQEFGRVPIRARDSIAYRGPMRCYPLADQTFIGLSYGALQQVFGIKASAYSAWQFGLPVRLAPDVTWRLPRNGNTYFHLELTKRDMPHGGKISLAPRVGYKRIVSDHRTTDQLYAGLGLWTWHHGLTLGYARQRLPAEQLGTTSANGLMLQLYSDFLNHLEVKASAIYWFHRFQYALALKEQIPGSHLAIGIGFEQIATWSEFDVSLGYWF